MEKFLISPLEEHSEMGQRVKPAKPERGRIKGDPPCWSPEDTPYVSPLCSVAWRLMPCVLQPFAPWLSCCSANREPPPLKGGKQRGKWCQDICTLALSLKGVIGCTVPAFNTSPARQPSAHSHPSFPCFRNCSLLAHPLSPVSQP